MRTLIHHIKELFCVEEQAPATWVAGADMAHCASIPNAYLLIEDENILDFGPMSECPERADVEIDATGRLVLPTWCDSHSHIVYAQPREQEFVDRIRGLSYEEIAAKGGGILNSAQRLRERSEDELFASALERLREVERFGTGALEIKSGYGLTLESELKMLRVIRRLKAETRMQLKATFLGAHAIPTAYKNRREEYLQLIVEEMLPRVADEGLADYCDVFCDRGFFTPKETDQILRAAEQYQLKAKIHANELDYSGGVQVGVANQARSVDHLECVGEAEIQVLLSSSTMPTLLPSTAFFLNIDYAPARQMIDAGLPVALASDYNPGSTPSGRMPFVLSLACIKMKMLPEEAINAATLNGAYAMELEQELGSIARGKTANILLTKPVSSLAFLPYAFGTDWVERSLLRGQ